jgi:hypothetical protein
VGKGLNASQGRIPAGASAMTRHLTPLPVSAGSGLAQHSGCSAVADLAGRGVRGDSGAFNSRGPVQRSELVSFESRSLELPTSECGIVCKRLTYGSGCRAR